MLVTWSEHEGHFQRRLEDPECLCLQVTFSKRRNGLLKKALELSILCKCDIAVVILPAGNKTLHQWTNLPTMDHALAKYQTIKEASGVRVQVEASATPLCCSVEAG